MTQIFTNLLAKKDPVLCPHCESNQIGPVGKYIVPQCGCEKTCKVSMCPDCHGYFSVKKINSKEYKVKADRHIHAFNSPLNKLTPVKEGFKLISKIFFAEMIDTSVWMSDKDMLVFVQSSIKEIKQEITQTDENGGDSVQAEWGWIKLTLENKLYNSLCNIYVKKNSFEPTIYDAYQLIGYVISNVPELEKIVIQRLSSHIRLYGEGVSKRIIKNLSRFNLAERLTPKLPNVEKIKNQIISDREFFGYSAWLWDLVVELKETTPEGCEMYRHQVWGILKKIIDQRKANAQWIGP